ncbi:MAG TPA: hypothetical protein DCL07_01270, partial [Cryomorphaceae bacterium]|nr:hypothetical protein [Cryomorphaceae bacterium]
PLLASFHEVFRPFVVDALGNALVIKHGVHASQIEVRSEGKESPANAVNADKNRRVEVYFKK